jgi:hypothetical protein
LASKVGVLRARSDGVTRSLEFPNDRRLASTIRDSLSQRLAIDDLTFDHLYPDEVRRLSHLHWTPVEVALLAAQWLAPEPAMRILDVGSGVGKMCCIGALASRARWHGIERDARRVAAALNSARALGVDETVRFTAGDMSSIDWAEFDSIYFFNPFETDLFGPDATDPGIAFPRFAQNVLTAQRRLAELRGGTRVVTYHGFGGEMPDGFEVCSREFIGTDELVLWVKRPEGSGSRWRAAA